MSTQPPLAFSIYARKGEPSRVVLRARPAPMEKAKPLGVRADRYRLHQKLHL